MNTNDLLKLAALGVGAYWVYTSFFDNQVPAAAGVPANGASAPPPPAPPPDIAGPQEPAAEPAPDTGNTTSAPPPPPEKAAEESAQPATGDLRRSMLAMASSSQQNFWQWNWIWGRVTGTPESQWPDPPAGIDPSAGMTVDDYLGTRGLAGMGSGLDGRYLVVN